MKGRINIVGHFGTTLSYATVGSHVARALKDAGLLGSVANLDAAWHPSFRDLRDYSPREPGTHVLLFTPPAHYLDVYVSQYGRERSAIFMSPNTDRLSAEHAETCAKFGLILVPSAWCEKVTYESCRLVTGDVFSPSDMDAMPEIVKTPIGVSPKLATGHVSRMMAIQGRTIEDPISVLHFSTDQFWPGRKGTEELLSAWSRLGPRERRRARLVIHAPPSLEAPLLYRIRDRGLDEVVSVVKSPTHGSEIEQLVKLFDDADLVIAPSRCEGFGLMLLSALVAGVPLLCTAQTGQYDFLGGMSGWLGVPTVEWGPVAGEEGEAPIINDRVLAASIRVALTAEALRQILASGGQDRSTAKHLGAWLWPTVLGRWVSVLGDWVTGGVDR